MGVTVLGGRWIGSVGNQAGRAGSLHSHPVLVTRLLPLWTIVSGDYAAEHEAARRVESQRPNWVVVWGVYSKEYVAFPLFQTRSSMVLASGNVSELASHMREVENQAEQLRLVKKRNT